MRFIATPPAMNGGRETASNQDSRLPAEQFKLTQGLLSALLCSLIFWGGILALYFSLTA